MIRKDTRYAFNLLKFSEICFVTYYVTFPVECSMCTWAKCVFWYCWVECSVCMFVPFDLKYGPSPKFPYWFSVYMTYPLLKLGYLILCHYFYKYASYPLSPFFSFWDINYTYLFVCEVTYNFCKLSLFLSFFFFTSLIRQFQFICLLVHWLSLLLLKPSAVEKLHWILSFTHFILQLQILFVFMFSISLFYFSIFSYLVFQTLLNCLYLFSCSSQSICRS